MKGAVLKIVALVAVLLIQIAAMGADASTKHWRATVKAAEQARLKRDFAGAAALLQQAAPEAAALGPKSSAENSFLLAWAYVDSGQPPRAMEVVNAALEKIGPNPFDRGDQVFRGLLLAAKAATASEMGKIDDALASALEGQKALDDAGAKFHPQAYALKLLIGNIYAQKKNYPEAEKAYKDALKQSESRRVVAVQEWSGAEMELNQYREIGSEVGSVRANSLLGHLMLQQEKVKEGEEYFTKALKAAEREYGKKSPAVTLPLEGLARAHLLSGKSKEFDADVQRIYDIANKTPGLEIWVIDPLWLKLKADLKSGNAASAAQTAEKLVMVFATQNYPTKLLATRTLELARENAMDDKALLELEETFRKPALAKYASDPKKATPMLLEFALAAENANKPNVALPNYEAMIKTEANAPEKNLWMASVGKVADNLVAQHKPAEALPYCQKITGYLREKYGDDSRVADAMDREAALLKELGRTAESAATIEKSQAVRKAAILKR